MSFKICDVFVIIVVLTCCKASLVPESELNCSFQDSINITDGVRNEDQSITYKGMIFPSEQYGKVNYTQNLPGLSKNFTKDYIRGCVCNIKTCLRLCCSFGDIYDDGICKTHEAINYTTFVKMENNDMKSMKLDEYFGLIIGMPCDDQLLIPPEEFLIKQTGEVEHGDKIFGYNQYCIVPYEGALQLLLCDEEYESHHHWLYIYLRDMILACSMVVSIPFIVATILVYLCLPELCNLHGKCLLSYLLGLAMSYISLSIVQLSTTFIKPIACKSLGYLIYFSFLSTFFWLCVISFDIWFKFRSISAIQVFSERKRFILYTIFAWGSSSFLTLAIFVLDTNDSFPEKLKPGIGIGTCFLRDNPFTKSLYFYSPLTVILTLNAIFFVLTALKIRHVQQELNRMRPSNASSRHKRNFNNNKDSFTVYFRLFIVMGVTWIMEVISFFISEKGSIFMVTDICNAIQGVIIFVLFVLKRRVLRLIKERWQKSFKKAAVNKPECERTVTAPTDCGISTSNLELAQIELNEMKTEM